MAGCSGKLPAAKGEPGTELSAPVFESTRYADTLFEVGFVAYKKRPVRSMASPNVNDPAGNGDPGIGVRDPVAELIVYPETWLPLVDTYRKRPDGSTTS